MKNEFVVVIEINPLNNIIVLICMLNQFECRSVLLLKSKSKTEAVSIFIQTSVVFNLLPYPTKPYPTKSVFIPDPSRVVVFENSKFQ